MNPIFPFRIEVNPLCPPNTIYLIAPRAKVRVVFPNGHVEEYYPEPEQEWARRCAVITNVGDL